MENHHIGKLKSLPQYPAIQYHKYYGCRYIGVCSYALVCLHDFPYSTTVTNLVSELTPIV